MIEVKHLTKRYGDRLAVTDLSFTIPKGQVFGFLGPNGAGKSTTMNIITGCLAPTSGEVRIGGYDILTQPLQAKKLVGYLPEQPPLYLERTPREYLTFVAGAKGVESKKIESEVQRVMALTHIEDVADRLIQNLSKGYKQRVGIAQALLGDPEVIILDEPTVGLDPRQMIEIRELIKNLGKDHTVILSSHILSEVQAVCQQVMIISKGKLMACDVPENLEKKFAATTTIEMIVEATEGQIREILGSVNHVTMLAVKQQADDTRRVKIELSTPASNDLCREIFFAFSRANKAILQMTMTKASLEDIFLELTGKTGKKGGKKR